VFIKPTKEEASYGIAQASFVETDEQLTERVAFIHEKFRQDAIVEEYIHGRELYVSVLGNDRLQVFPIREMLFQESRRRTAVRQLQGQVDDDYRKRWASSIVLPATSTRRWLRRSSASARGFTGCSPLPATRALTCG